MRSGWAEVPLMDLCRPKQWPTISSGEMSDAGYPVYGANGRIGFYSQYNHESPTLLVTCRGATCGTVNISEPRSYVTGNAMALDELDPHRADLRFMYYALVQRGFADTITGTAQPQITRESLRAVTVLLPPLPEQRRIADILDKADAIRRKRKEAIALTEELLRSAFLEMFGDPVTNPKGWPVLALGEVVADIQGGWSPTCEAEPPRDGEWGMLKLGAVTTGRYLDSESKALGTEHAPDPSLEVHAGDVLFARKNTYEHVAACVYVAETRPKLMFPDLVFRLVARPEPVLQPLVLWATLRHAGKRKEIQSLAGGTSGSMPNIAKGRLRDVLLPVPPTTIQDRFTRWCRVVNELSRQAELCAEEGEALHRALVARAFSGAVDAVGGAKGQLSLPVG